MWVFQCVTGMAVNVAILMCSWSASKSCLDVCSSVCSRPVCVRCLDVGSSTRWLAIIDVIVLLGEVVPGCVDTITYFIEESRFHELISFRRGL